MSANKSLFNDNWLTKPEYSCRLTCKDEKRLKAFCNVCKKLFDISNMGEPAVKSHAKGSKHLNMLKMPGNVNSKIQNYYAPSRKTNVAQSNPVQVPSPSSPSTITGTSNISDQIALNNYATRAEIIWAMKSISSNYSYNSCQGIPELFKVMFPESDTVQAFAMSKTKLRYIVHYGLAPYFLMNWTMK